MFQWSLEVPVNWELANVPVLKTGRKDDPGNCRPISLTSVTGKFMEELILRITEQYLKDNAVTRGKSCLENLLFLQRLPTELAKGSPLV